MFEFYDTLSKTREKIGNKVSGLTRETINELMLDHRYIQVIEQDTEDGDYMELIANKEKFIADRVAKYLSATINIFIKELYNEKSPQEKLKNLQSIVSPDLLLADDSSQEEIPLLSAESLLHRIEFAPHGMEYNPLVKNNPKYRQGTI
jgi:hypothetical protein